MKLDLRVGEMTFQGAMQKIAELQAIVDKLPKTADGVTVVLGDEAWYPKNFYGEPIPPVVGWLVEGEDGDGYAVQFMLPGHNPIMETLCELPVIQCYSTQAAAKAAKEATECPQSNT